MAAGPMANQRGHHVPEPMGQFWGSNGDTETPRAGQRAHVHSFDPRPLWDTRLILMYFARFAVCRQSDGHQEQQILVLGRKLFRPGAGAQGFTQKAWFELDAVYGSTGGLTHTKVTKGI